MRHKVYVVIPFYSDGITINENDVLVFDNFEDAENYYNSLQGSPTMIEAVNIVDYYLRIRNSAGFQGDAPTDGLSGFRG
jgi:hypothetical protein